ncbi:hypothetical protein EQH57_0319 [Dictyocoela roeselum]|nr:hypothetical protein EQH57_0319 [Dictyocoela roeselum]
MLLSNIRGKYLSNQRNNPFNSNSKTNNSQSISTALNEMIQNNAIFIENTLNISFDNLSEKIKTVADNESKNIETEINNNNDEIKTQFENTLKTEIITSPPGAIANGLEHPTTVPGKNGISQPSENGTKSTVPGEKGKEPINPSGSESVTGEEKIGAENNKDVLISQNKNNSAPKNQETNLPSDNLAQGSIPKDEKDTNKEDPKESVSNGSVSVKTILNSKNYYESLNDIFDNPAAKKGFLKRNHKKTNFKIFAVDEPGIEKNTSEGSKPINNSNQLDKVKLQLKKDVSNGKNSVQWDEESKTKLEEKLKPLTEKEIENIKPIIENVNSEIKSDVVSILNDLMTDLKREISENASEAFEKITSSIQTKLK